MKWLDALGRREQGRVAKNNLIAGLALGLAALERLDLPFWALPVIALGMMALLTACLSDRRAGWVVIGLGSSSMIGGLALAFGGYAAARLGPEDFWLGAGGGAVLGAVAAWTGYAGLGRFLNELERKAESAGAGEGEGEGGGAPRE